MSSYAAAVPRRPNFMMGVELQSPVISPAFSSPAFAIDRGVPAGRLRVVTDAAVETGPAVVGEQTHSLPDEILLSQAVNTPVVTQAPPPPAPPPAPVIDMSRMDAAIERLRLTSERLAAEVRADALEVAMLLARKIVEGELTTNVDRLLGCVRSVVRRLGESRRVVVRLCPADAELLSANGSRSPADIAGLSAAKVEVVADPSLQRGDCMVEGELGAVDGRLDTRFAEMRRAIAESAAEDQA